MEDRKKNNSYSIFYICLIFLEKIVANPIEYKVNFLCENEIFGFIYNIFIFLYLTMLKLISSKKLLIKLKGSCFLSRTV